MACAALELVLLRPPLKGWGWDSNVLERGRGGKGQRKEGDKARMACTVLVLAHGGATTRSKVLHRMFVLWPCACCPEDTTDGQRGGTTRLQAPRLGDRGELWGVVFAMGQLQASCKAHRPSHRPSPLLLRPTQHLVRVVAEEGRALLVRVLRALHPPVELLVVDEAVVLHADRLGQDELSVQLAAPAVQQDALIGEHVGVVHVAAICRRGDRDRGGGRLQGGGEDIRCTGKSAGDRGAA